MIGLAKTNRIIRVPGATRKQTWQYVKKNNCPKYSARQPRIVCRCNQRLDARITKGRQYTLSALSVCRAKHEPWIRLLFEAVELLTEFFNPACGVNNLVLRASIERVRLRRNVQLDKWVLHTFKSFSFAAVGRRATYKFEAV